MKLLLFSDLHLDAQFSWLGAGAQAARERRQALRQTLCNITALARSVGADALLCGGDLYEHDRISPDSAAFLRNTFAEVDPLPVYVAPGNHDWYGPTSAYAQVNWSPNVHVFTGDRLADVRLAPRVTLWGAAHRGPATPTGFLDGFSTSGSGVHLALFHGSERAPFATADEVDVYAPFSAEDIPRAGLRHAFLGHHHRPREADTHTYPGNPDPLAFGEDGVRGAVEIEVSADGVIRRHWHAVTQTVVKDISLDITGCASQQDVRDRIRAAVGTAPCFARVTLHGDLDPALDLDLRDLSTPPLGIHGLVVQLGAVHPAYDFDAIAQQPTVTGVFVREVRAAIGDPEEQRRVLVTGLRALAGRTDLEVR